MALVLCAGLLPLLVIVVIKHQVQNKDTVIRCFYICVILSGLFIGTKLRTSSMLLLVFMATGIVISLFIRTRIILEYVVVSVGVLLYIGIFQASIVHEYFSSALYFVYLFMYCGSGIALIFYGIWGCQIQEEYGREDKYYNRDGIYGPAYRTL